MQINYVYLLQEREFHKTGENIYKVGKTKQANLFRFKGYPKDSLIIYQSMCDDCDKAENEILTIFREQFQQKTEIGSEYFQGDYLEMIDIMHNVVLHIRKPMDSESIKMRDMCARLGEIFPDYENDASFGGTAKYVRIVDKGSEGMYVEYINQDINNEKFNDYQNYGTPESFYHYVVLYKFIGYDGYLRFLLDQGVVTLNTPYDITSHKLMQLLEPFKTSIIVEDFPDIQADLAVLQDTTPLHRLISQAFESNLQVNNVYLQGYTAHHQYVMVDGEVQKIPRDNVYDLRGVADFNVISTKLLDSNRKEDRLKNLFVKVGDKYYSHHYFHTHFPKQVRYNYFGQYLLVQDPTQHNQTAAVADNKFAGLFNTDYTKFHADEPGIIGVAFAMVHMCRLMIRTLRLRKCLNPNVLFQYCVLDAVQ